MIVILSLMWNIYLVLNWSILLDSKSNFHSWILSYFNVTVESSFQMKLKYLLLVVVYFDNVKCLLQNDYSYCGSALKETEENFTKFKNYTRN
jgi:hypothetical protein